MQDKSQEAFRYLLLALVPGAIAVVCQNPAIKFGAAITAAAAIAKAGECYRSTAKEAYSELNITTEIKQLYQA